jgi:hypothetical protein
VKIFRVLAENRTECLSNTSKKRPFYHSTLCNLRYWELNSIKGIKKNLLLINTVFYKQTVFYSFSKEKTFRVTAVT